MILKGKNAIITGSNQGFGKVIAEKFIEEGANVMICARDYGLLDKIYNELYERLNPEQKLHGTTLDISNYEDIKVFHDYTISLFNGKVDILINNAGIYGVKGLVDIKDFKAWKETIDINLMGTVNMCMSFLSELKESHGKIINISGGGATNPRTHFSAYATSKAAVVRFSECLAEELREFNVDVNCVAPGALNTRILDEAISDGIEKVGIEYYIKALAQKMTGGDSMETGAELCAFLASEKCNGITGKIISAKWDDWENLPNHKQELNKSDIYTLRRVLPWDKNPYWMEKL
jgi:NAD(P)-dependent dehydrogenase (short-subunit alcohol dehydrogenase family)